MITALAINFLAVTGLVTALSRVNRLLGPRPRLDGDKGLPYETGMPPLEPGLGRMGVLYQRYALLFVAFDVDLAFLLPWALLRDRLTTEAMAAMSLLLFLVGLTLAYVWRKGALSID